MTVQDYFILRRNIIQVLYELFKAVPYAAVDLGEIETQCQSDPATLNWNLVYLEKCGFVELGKAYETPPYVACSAMITEKGIDLIENEDAFNRKFPIKS